MITFVSKINEIQKLLFWVSNFQGAIILNSCDTSGLPYRSKAEKLFVWKQ